LTINEELIERIPHSLEARNWLVPQAVKRENRMIIVPFFLSYSKRV